MKLLIGILIFMIPFLVLGWSIAFNQPGKKIIRNALLAALVMGGILQTLFNLHVYQSGTDIILFVLVIISTVLALIIYFGFNFTYKKLIAKNKDKS